MPAYRLWKSERPKAHKHHQPQLYWKSGDLVVIREDAIGRYLASLSAKEQHRAHAAELVTGGLS